MMAVCLVILRTRKLRRRLIFQVAITVMIIIAVGLWPLASFLNEHPLLFGIFWLISFAALILLFLLTIYDMVRIPREIMGEAARNEKKLRDELITNPPAAAGSEEAEEADKKADVEPDR